MKDKSLILKDVNLISGTRNNLEKSMAISIRNGVIEEIKKIDNITISKEAEVISLSGKTVIPGLIDSHVHLFQSGVDDFMKPYAERLINKFKRNCYITICSGVTTVRNMPAYNHIFKYKKKVDSGEIIGPRILASGSAISVPYGYFSKLSFMPFNGFIRFFLERFFRIKDLSIDIKDEYEAKNVVRKLKKEGVDFIKTITPGSNYPYARDEKFKQELLDKGVKEEQIDASMDFEILKAIVNEAKKVNLEVACHNIYGTKGFSDAVKAGASSIEHTPIGLISDDTFDFMNENNTFWVPTIYAFYNWKSLIDNPKLYENEEIKELIPESLHSFGRKSLEEVRKDIASGGFWSKFYNEIDLLKTEYFPSNLSKAIEKGVKIAAGVDCGAGGAGYVPHGQLYKELEVYVENGMDEFAAIQTATKNAAELLGILDEVGTISVGKKADIVVLDSNPLENISNLKEINLVIKEGKILFNKSSQ